MNTLKRLIGIGDREFYSTLFKLSLPIIIQNGLASLLYLVDNIMIGRVGEVELASVGAANQLYFILMMFTFGISSGASIFVAQYWGKRDLESIHRVHGMALICSVVISLGFIALGFFGGKFVLSIYSQDPAVIALGAKYLRIACIGYLFQSISVVYLCVLRSSENVVLSMVSSIIAIVVNTTLNYILIFGKFGFVAMGVEGAAIATSIAAFVGLAVVVLYSYACKNVAAAKLKDLIRFDLALLKEFFKVSMPVFINEGLWSIGTSLYAVLYGLMGTKAVAAMQIYGTLDRIAFVVFIGVGNACAIMIGNRIGEKRSDVAAEYAKRFLVLGAAIGVVVGVIVFSASSLFVDFYNVSNEVKEIASGIMRVFSFGIWMFVCNFISIVGIMRSGGDTVYSTCIDIGGLWLISLPMAYFAALVLKWPMWAVYACILPGDIFKLVISLRRIKKGVWINDLTVRTADLSVEIADTHI